MSSGTNVSPAGPSGAGRSLRHRFPAGLLAGLLPAQVAVVDAFDQSFDGSRLIDTSSAARDVAFAEEFAALGGAARRRRQEFARARICAHTAVAALGRSPVPIGIGHHRDPRWPAGLTGSITHCPGYRAAAVGSTADVLAVGVDAEPDEPLSAGVGRLAFTDTDRAGSGRLARFRNWDRVAFSARESAFKAWFTVTGRRLDVADATLFVFPDGSGGGDFRATIGAGVAGVQELALACGSAVLEGRFGWAHGAATPAGPGLVLTAVTLLRRGRH